MSDSTLQSTDRRTRIVHELKNFALATLYLWCVFELFAIYRTMILKEHGVDVWEQTFAIVNALIFPKVIVTAQMFKLGRRFKEVPIIYTALGTALVFAIVILLFQTAEETVRAAVQGLPLAGALAEVGGGTVAGILTALLVFFVSLLSFVTVQEVARVLGGSNVWHLFLAHDKENYKLIHR
jgi:hypothetical protein